MRYHTGRSSQGPSPLCLIVQLPVTCPPNHARRGKRSTSERGCSNRSLNHRHCPLSVHATTTPSKVRYDTTYIEASRSLRRTVQRMLGPFAFTLSILLLTASQPFYFLTFVEFCGSFALGYSGDKRHMTI